MPNVIDLVTKYLPLLDEVFKRSSITGELDVAGKNVQFVGANTVKYFKTSMDGLGDYDNDAGFVAGSVTGSWETKTLSLKRARQFEIDNMDNEESLMMAFGTLAGEFIRTKVVPEVDAVRFARYASTSGISTTAGAALDSTNIIAALDAAAAQMDEDEVPQEGRILYITPTLYTAMKNTTAVSRFVQAGNSIDRNFELFDTMKIRKVPQTRFYTGVTLLDGESGGEEAGGYTKTASTGKNINFMIVHPSAVEQITKHARSRVIAPENNKQKDAYVFDYLIYHDAFAYDNKVDGIYLHKSTT